MSEILENTQPEVNDVGNDINVGSNDAINETSQKTEQQTVNDNQQQSFKVKYLHEEKEIPYSEAPTYIQKGMDYDRVKSKYEESKPVLSFVERLAQQNGLSVPDYLKAVEEYEKQQEIEALSQKNSLDPELAEELYLLRQERQQRQTAKQQQDQEARQQQEYIEFINQFPDVKPDAIPNEVWQIKANNNLTITDAYIRHEYNKLREKINAQETNLKNANVSTGSLTGNGNATSDFIDAKTFENKKDDRRWVMQNLDRIMKSRAKW